MYLTPGPWKTFCKTLVVRDADKFHRVAECNEADDATLMAAAPEMLDALKRARAWVNLEMSGTVSDHSLLADIDAAIAKAERRP